MPLRRLLAPVAALLVSACGSRLFHTPGPTPYERMSMIDCAADVASARGFAVRARRLNEGYLVAEGGSQNAGGSDDAAAAGAPRVDVLTVAVSRQDDTAPIAVQAESFVVRDSATGEVDAAPAKQSRLRRSARAVHGWAHPSPQVVELRSAVLDRCGGLAVRR